MRYITPSPSEDSVSNSQQPVVAREIDTSPVEVPTVKMKPNPAYIETKSRRVQLLLQPTLHKRLTVMAKSERKSFNEYVHSILEKHISTAK
jgi:hypothetical protein